MKKYVLFLFFAISNLIINAQSQDKVPYMVKPLANEIIKNVQVETSGGNISVASVPPGEARLEVYVQQNNFKNELLSKEEIKKRLDEEYDFRISVADNKLSVFAKPKNNNMDWKRSLSISFKVFVTRNVSTQLSTSGGNISLKDISGEQSFRTSGGNLNLENISGKIKGKTSGGNMHLNNLKNDIELSTSGGNIDANNCSGNIRISTSGGSLKLNGLQGNITATTSGGNVSGDNIAGELIAKTSGGNVNLKNLSCSLETSTSGGHIDVGIKEAGKYIKIHNSGGNIELEIPKNKGIDLDLNASKIKTDGLNNFNGSKDDDEIRGKLNGGGIPVIVKASSGTIHLTVK